MMKLQPITICFGLLLSSGTLFSQTHQTQRLWPCPDYVDILIQLFTAPRNTPPLSR